MSGTYLATMRARGHVVVPAELRERANLTPGRPLIFVETPVGLLLLTREQLRDLVRSELGGEGLVSSLLADRRAAATGEGSR